MFDIILPSKNLFHAFWNSYSHKDYSTIKYDILTTSIAYVFLD